MAFIRAAHIRKNACRVGAPEHPNDIRAEQAIAYEVAFVGVVAAPPLRDKPFIREVGDQALLAGSDRKAFTGS